MTKPDVQELKRLVEAWYEAQSALDNAGARKAPDFGDKMRAFDLAARNLYRWILFNADALVEALGVQDDQNTTA